MIDTHTHIYLPEYEEGNEEIVKRALKAGINHMVFPATDLISLQLIRKLHEAFPEETSMAAGLHPTDVGEDWEAVVDEIEKELATGLYKAVGEVGIDLYWDKSKLDLQRKAFEKQLELAVKYNLTVIIHSRDAFPETLECIRKVNPGVPLIFHSFTGNTDIVRKIRKETDAWFGINGVVTYKNATSLREALKEIGIERILLETDSPYLTPVPFRGKRNESSYLHFICEKIAEVLAMSPDSVEKITDSNAETLFHT